MDGMQKQKISFNELLELEKDAKRLLLCSKQFYAFCEKYCGVKSPDEKVADDETWMEQWFADWRNHAEDVTKYFDNKELFDKNAKEEDKRTFEKYLENREMFDMNYQKEIRGLDRNWHFKGGNRSALRDYKDFDTDSERS